jgi:hypothetical protein
MFDDAITIGTTVRIHSGKYAGCRGTVKDMTLDEYPKLDVRLDATGETVRIGSLAYYVCTAKEERQLS